MLKLENANNTLPFNNTGYNLPCILNWGGPIHAMLSQTTLDLLHCHSLRPTASERILECTFQTTTDNTAENTARPRRSLSSWQPPPLGKFLYSLATILADCFYQEWNDKQLTRSEWWSGVGGKNNHRKWKGKSALWLCLRRWNTAWEMVILISCNCCEVGRVLEGEMMDIFMVESMKKYLQCGP